MNSSLSTCPECGQKNLYTVTTNSGGRYGPMLLPNLGGFLRLPQFRVVTCADCGLTRFYADDNARAKLPISSKWKRL
jgi:predicted nucleic-acid-binding Zn-ribbon protein